MSEPTSSSKPFISWDSQSLGPITRLILILCCGLFFLSQYFIASQKIPENFKGFSIFTSPIDMALLYDYPEAYQLLNRFISIYGYEALEANAQVPPSGKRLLEKIQTTPIWPGIYPLLLKGGWADVKEEADETPMFEKIQQGEIWRLVTSCLLHADIFHLFFNMIWLIVLGKQIEQRIKTSRYLIFLLTVGAFSNTSQYLMSGSNFIGFSGILCGMLLFIWARQKQAPWEGYRLDRMTLLFMFVYILGMAGIQLFAFLYEKAFSYTLTPNIANTAHLSGGLAGYLLGRLNFFSWRHA